MTYLRKRWKPYFLCGAMFLSFNLYFILLMRERGTKYLWYLDILLLLFLFLFGAFGFVSFMASSFLLPPRTDGRGAGDVDRMIVACLLLVGNRSDSKLRITQKSRACTCAKPGIKGRIQVLSRKGEPLRHRT